MLQLHPLCTPFNTHTHTHPGTRTPAQGRFKEGRGEGERLYLEIWFTLGKNRRQRHYLPFHAAVERELQPIYLTVS